MQKKGRSATLDNFGYVRKITRRVAGLILKLELPFLFKMLKRDFSGYFLFWTSKTYNFTLSKMSLNSTVETANN